MISSNNLAHLHFTSDQIFTVYFPNLGLDTSFRRARVYLGWRQDDDNNRKDIEVTETGEKNLGNQIFL